MAKGFSQVTLAVLIPLSLGTAGLWISNKDKSFRLDKVIEKVTSQIGEDNEEIKRLRIVEGNIVPSRYLNLEENNNFLDHLLARERVNKCNFKVSLSNINEIRSVDEINEERTYIDKVIKKDMENTTWNSIRRMEIDKACMRFREVRITKSPSTNLGLSHWTITGLDGGGTKQKSYHIWHNQK